MRTVVDPAGRPGMAIGVDPARRSLTNTRAPAGRDCTLSPPTVALASPIALAGKPGGVVFAFPPSERRLIVIDDVGRRAVNCSVRSSAAYPSRATRMLYDPSASSRSATGVFPRGFPFTSTSASAGVDRINMLPVGARPTAPDAGRDGVRSGARAGRVQRVRVCQSPRQAQQARSRGDRQLWRQRQRASPSRIPQPASARTIRQTAPR